MTEQSKGRAPVVTLTVDALDNRRTLKLHLREKRGRGNMAQVSVEHLDTKEQAVDLLVERARSWSDPDRRTIRGKAHKLMWNVPWPLNEKWLAENGGDSRL